MILSKAPTLGWRFVGQGGQSRVCRGASGAGRAPGHLQLPTRAGTGLGVGTGSHGRQARCSGKECHAASVWGLTACSSSGETQPLAPARPPCLQLPRHPCVSCTISSHARNSHEQCPTEKTTRAVIKARGNLPVLPARARQPAVIPAAVAKFLRCCPRKESRQRAFAQAAPWESPASGSCERQWGSRETFTCIKCSATNWGYGPIAHALSKVCMGVTHLGSDPLASSSSES